MKKRRTTPHNIETKSCDYVRTVIDSHYENGDALFREVSGRDYGIDAIIELFSEGIPSGKIAFVQIKGTCSKIKQLKSSPHISCQISSSNVNYAIQKRIPVLLFYVYLGEEGYFFYYARLQDILTQENIKKSKIIFAII